MKTYLTQIKNLQACNEAVKWLEESEFTSLNDAWQVCERGDWMLWLVGRFLGVPESDSRKKVILVACECARLALPYVTKDELRPLKTIETAEAWARGENSITLADVRVAASAAYASASAAYASAYAAAYAAHAAAYAAYAASSRRIVILSQCADIVREAYPVAPDLS